MGQLTLTWVSELRKVEIALKTVSLSNAYPSERQNQLFSPLAMLSTPRPTSSISGIGRANGQ